MDTVRSGGRRTAGPSLRDGQPHDADTPRLPSTEFEALRPPSSETPDSDKRDRG